MVKQLSERIPQNDLWKVNEKAAQINVSAFNPDEGGVNQLEGLLGSLCRQPQIIKPSSDSNTNKNKKLCNFFKKGRCANKDCKCLHELTAPKANTAVQPDAANTPKDTALAAGASTKPTNAEGLQDCNAWYKTGNCTRGNACKFAHVPDRKGTGQKALCNSIASSGSCRFGSTCRLAHTKEDMVSNAAEGVINMGPGSTTHAPPVHNYFCHEY